MRGWFFPSRGYGDTEGFSNPGLELFKGEPLRAMAREICQNSLDAKLKNNQPMKIVFEKHFINTSDFPGISELQNILEKCRDFWRDQDDAKARDFINTALKTISDRKLFVLRVSDYNTTGVRGAFDPGNITPWKSLVQGTAFSIKQSSTAAGSYGIGKAAPFVVSRLQTVFYRTYDDTGVQAVQGVTHLVSFQDAKGLKSGDDPVRRSTGYYCEGTTNVPLRRLPELDRINARNETGTDLFIPGFNTAAGKTSAWKDEIIIEILDNFLYAIYSGKMVAVVDDSVIDRENVEGYIRRFLPKTKHAASFYSVISDGPDVLEEIRPFHGIGQLRFRLLYAPDANKKVLVVRDSGMKITDIPSLPKAISYVGFLELQGESLNRFFREMENPQHNRWEPKRHSNPEKARQYKEEIENWVRSYIGEKIKDISGEEIDIDVSAYFTTSENGRSQPTEDEHRENIIDTVKSIDVVQEEPRKADLRVRDIGGNKNPASKSTMKSGTIDDQGTQTGHRKRTGKRSGGSPTGRKGRENTSGDDKIYEQTREVLVNARIIRHTGGRNRLVLRAKDYIREGELEIVTIGENGKALRLLVKSVTSPEIDAFVTDGHIAIRHVEADKKYSLDFEIYAEAVYAMGVRAYGN